MSYDPSRPEHPEHAGAGFAPPSAYPSPDRPTGLGPHPHTGTSTDRGPSNGLAVGGFVCAAVGAVAAFIPYVGILAFPVLVLGLVLCAVGLGRSPHHRGLAVAGLVAALVALPVDALITTATLTEATSLISSTAPSAAAAPSPSNTSTSPSGSSSTADGSGSSDGYTAGGGYTAGRYPYPAAVPDTGIGAGYTAADLAYLQTLEHYDVPVSSDDDAVGLGQAVCDYLDGGGTSAGAAQILINEGFPAYDAHIIVGAAEGAYCSTN